MAICSVCHKEEDAKLPDGTEVELRPYGVNGALICYECMVNDPVREAEAKRQLHARLDVASEDTGVAAIGHPGGPQPFDPEKL